MGRLIALLLGGFGLGAYFQSRRRRRPGLERSPALELKAKLAESRHGAVEPELEPELEPSPEPEPEATLEGDLAARRRDVHGRARGAIDELS